MSLFPFVYPFALIWPIRSTPPSGKTAMLFPYSLNDGVPMYFTKTVETGLDLATLNINISKNPLLSDDDWEYPVM